MNGWLKLLFEIGDYIVRGAIAYASTPEGQKELDDITAAWEARANNDDNEGTVVFSVSDIPVSNSGAGGQSAPVSPAHRPVPGSKPAQ